MKSRFEQWKQWTHSHLDVAVDLVRIYLGLGLVMKGIFFLSQKEYLAGMLPAGSSIPAAMVNAVGPIHIIGGAMLALGLLTRIAAAIQIPVLLGAVFYVSLPMMTTVEGRQNFEFTALVLYLTVLFAVFGSGRLSLDRRMKAAPAHMDVCWDMLRIYLGIGLFMKGFYFIAQREHLSSLITQAGDLSLIPATLVHYIIPVHLVGGVLIMLGLITRIAAIAQLPILLGATFYVLLPHFLVVEMRQDFEFTALVLFLTSLFAAFGTGRYAIDRQIEKERTSPALAHAHA